MDGIDEFDAGLFRLAAGEATTLDPQARILLEQTAEALHQADALMLQPRVAAQCGVYIGCMYTEYLDTVLGPLVRSCRAFKSLHDILHMLAQGLQQSTRLWHSLCWWRLNWKPS